MKGFARGALDMPLKRVYIACILGQTFKLNKTDRNPDKLIVRRGARSNCRLQKGKSGLSTDVDKLVRNSRDI